MEHTFALTELLLHTYRSNTHAPGTRSFLTMPPSPIQVTQTTLPPLEDYYPLLQRVWERNWVTNNGPLAKQLEQRLSQRFQAPHCLLTTNGTIAIQLALRALGVTGSVITTPFSYVATTNALLYEKLTPVFVDIEPEWFTLDPALVEAAIRPDTTAILATHVYGYPCRHRELQDIADRRGLKLIYDAAHAFGVRVDGKSLLRLGDMSTLSFHATKVFHTIEGGAVVGADAGAMDGVDRYRSFGHIGREYLQLGINGKNSELHAGIGLLNLDLVDEQIERSRIRSERYVDGLHRSGIRVLSPKDYPGLTYNYGYLPVVCPSEEQRENIVTALNAEHVFPRRYFEPSLNELPFLPRELRSACPVSERAARTVLCLPLYPTLALSDVDRICATVTSAVFESTGV